MAPWRDSTLLHRVPDARVVVREEELARAASGHRVIHIGFVDDRRLRSGLVDPTSGLASTGVGRTWLHRRLGMVARDLVGLDLDRDGVAAARALGFECYVADVQDAHAVAALPVRAADVVIAGEIIEHLDRPGAFLDAIKPLVNDEGVLVITTPNPMRLSNFVAAALGREFVAEDHVGWHSWHTLSTLLAHHGWAARGLAYYMHPRRTPGPGLGAVDRTKLNAVGLLRAAAGLPARVAPSLADGLILTAARAG